MKLSSFHFLSLILPLSLSAQTYEREVVQVDPNCCGNTPAGTPLEIQSQPSAADLNARRQTAAANGYGRASLSILAEKVEVKTKEASLLGESEFLLGAAGGFTIVPRGGTVTPSRSVKVLSEAPEGGTLQTWKEFQRRNPATVRLLPISDKALSGDKAAVEAITKKIEAMQTGGIAYVTSFNGNPVSLPFLSSPR